MRSRTERERERAKSKMENRMEAGKFQKNYEKQRKRS